jgi:hypothetical protein
MGPFQQVLGIGLCLLASGGTVWSQDRNASRDDRISPERLGLPKGNTRTSEPFVTRIYKTDDLERILKPQPPGYPFTIHEDYTLKVNEKPQPHKGVDLSSRPAPGLPPKPLDLKAGVYGLVVKAGDGPWGTISVQLRDGSVLQYLHTSKSHVKVGDLIAPDTPLGVTGKTGAGVIHLHVQARNKHHNAMSPDLAFRLGQKKLATPIKPEEDAGADFDPEQYVGVQPKVVKGVVHKIEPESKWISEVIGSGGKVDLVLGEFPTYQDASHCSLDWSEAHPDDLRLTREIEVKIAGGGD